MERKNSCTKHPCANMVGVCSFCLTERLNQLLVIYSCEKYSSPRSPFNLKIRTGDVAGNKMSGDGIEKSGVSFRSTVIYFRHRKHGSRVSSRSVNDFLYQS
ncbi:hypothetical protein SUGI_0312080 [Cryptomeria japonica]|nr:hypothetical protein SUGI_0312080 [Cryptomeria japonica]